MITRRAMIGTGLAAGAALALPAIAAAAKPVKITTYRNPSCGCCGKWIDAARAAGFEVTVVPVDDIMAVKAKHNVPDQLASCHTSLVGGYVVEGHVPFDAVRRLLEQKPKLTGIAVPGMPAGAPGMEVPSGRRQDFQVMAFDAAGKVSVYG